MTYPGTKPRDRTALESSLAQDVLRLEKERDELVEALRPFAHYADAREAMPLRGLSYVIHSIHTGTEWEAQITLNQCQQASRVLAKYRSSAGS